MPGPVEQVNVLAAAVAATPALTEIEATLLGGYVNIHCTAAGELPAGELNTKFRAISPLEAAVPEERAKISGPAWPNKALADTSKARAKILATWPCDENPCC